jgi:hypothetical protein
MLYLIIGGINFLVMLILLLYAVNTQKKKSYAIILNKEGETIKSLKINPSYTEINHDYEGKKYTYLKPKNSSYIKHKNNKYYLFEFNKPELINPVNENNPIIYSDVLNELLLMAKIKALNKEENVFSGLFSKKNLFIGLIIIVGIIVLVNGGI